MGHGDQPLGDGSEPINPQSVHGQAPERGHELNAVDLAVAVSVFAQLRVAWPVSGILNAPAVAHVFQQRVSSMDLPLRLLLLRTAITVALPGEFTTTQLCAGIPWIVQVMSRP